MVGLMVGIVVGMMVGIAKDLPSSFPLFTRVSEDSNKTKEIISQDTHQRFQRDHLHSHSPILLIYHHQNHIISFLFYYNR